MQIITHERVLHTHDVTCIFLKLVSMCKTDFPPFEESSKIGGNKIFISTGYRRGCALFEFDGKSLRQIYTNKNMSNHMNN